MDNEAFMKDLLEIGKVLLTFLLELGKSFLTFILEKEKAIVPVLSPVSDSFYCYYLLTLFLFLIGNTVTIYRAFVNVRVLEVLICSVMYYILITVFVRNLLIVAGSGARPVQWKPKRTEREFGAGKSGRIGKLFLSDNVIGLGTNGTVVYEGKYEDAVFDGQSEHRPVAVKRLIKVHYRAAFKEIQNLNASGGHPNVVRFFGKEEDDHFVYLILERCICNVTDLVHMFSKNSAVGVDKSDDQDYSFRMDKLRVRIQDTELWKDNGYPSPTLFKLMRDMADGLAHLHRKRIVHRDLKPENMLIIKDGTRLRVKLSDMGISKRLTGDMVSLGQLATGFGTPGWQAREVLCGLSQTEAADLFSLGCVFYFCISAGRHPFGNRHKRDANIRRNKVNLSSVENLPEAKELITRLLNSNPAMRPSATEVLAHPLFWDEDMRLSFICDTSNRLERERKKSQLSNDIASTSTIVLAGEWWNKKMDPDVLHQLLQRRRYNFKSIRDLLRAMRNMSEHFDVLPKPIQQILGSKPEGYYNYFASRFPNLLIEVYNVMRSHCRDEECFVRYFK